MKHPTLERQIISHRGLNRQAPENTLAAFGLAAQAGVTWLETDVDILGDGTPIILHDSTLDRTTSASGQFYDLTSADLNSIDAGSWFSEAFQGERIPTLAEFVQFLNDNHMNCNVELKSNEQDGRHAQLLVDNVLKELEKLDPKRQIVISSFSLLQLYLLHQKAPQFSTAVLYETGAIRADWKAVLELVGADYIHPDQADVTRERVAIWREAGFGVNVWTVDDPGRANELLNWGCTGVISNVADQLLRLTSVRSATE